MQPCRTAPNLRVAVKYRHATGAGVQYAVVPHVAHGLQADRAVVAAQRGLRADEATLGDLATSPMIQPVGCTQAPGSDARRDAIEAVRLLDTGLDTRQRPYLALQYVKGQSRREWCSAQRVGAFELTRLFCSWHRPLATFTAVVSCTAT